jgi:hypothetical protein
LEGAAKYYLKAGLETDSEYAKASKLLLDAYVYMDKASKEEDETKKAKLYAMTEKVLQASASAFSKANYPKRRDQAAMLLKKVKEEKEMAVALSEVLLAPDLVSKTMELSAPMPSHESAVGLERFEHADVQVAVLARKKDLKVGEVLDLQIELVNAGKAPAQLTKIEGIAPSGFEVVAKPDGYRLEDNYIAMKGKRLDSLKTDEVSLTLKAVEAGVFIIKPSILYLDETGSYKSFETAGVEITVKELGVAGWLRGPEKKK